MMRLQDLRAVAAIAKRHHARTYIDNTYCTPVFQNPLDLGIDIVVHTISKYIGGHSNIIGGVLVANDEELYPGLPSFPQYELMKKQQRVLKSRIKDGVGLLHLLSYFF